MILSCYESFENPTNSLLIRADQDVISECRLATTSSKNVKNETVIK